MADRKRAPVLLACAFFFLTAEAFAMTPPAMSVEVSPGSPLRGVGAAAGRGSGVSLSVRRNVRTALRAGTKGVANPNEERGETTRTALFADASFGRRLSAAVSVPYLSTKVSFRDPATSRRVTRRVSGLGDVAVFARYALWRQRRFGPAREWLGIAGAELGTGSIREEDDGGNRLAATLQPGSGTVDLVAGTAFLWGTSRGLFYADASYKKNGRRAYAFGDLFAANAGLNVRFAKDRLSLLTEFNGEFSGRDRSDLQGAAGREPDGTVRNTGGESVYFSPALQWRPAENLAITAGLQTPLFQNFRGTQLEAGTTYTLGVYAFFADYRVAR